MTRGPAWPRVRTGGQASLPVLLLGRPARRGLDRALLGIELEAERADAFAQLLDLRQGVAAAADRQLERAAGLRERGKVLAQELEPELTERAADRTGVRLGFAAVRGEALDQSVHVLHALPQRLDRLEALALLKGGADGHGARNLTGARPRGEREHRLACASADEPR